MSRHTLAVLLVLALPVVAVAQQSSPATRAYMRWNVFRASSNLEGITAIGVAAGTPDTDQRECGIDMGALRLRASRAILDGGLKVDKAGEENVPTLDVRVAAIALPESVCAAYLRVEFYAPAVVTPLYNQVVPTKQLFDRTADTPPTTAIATIGVVQLEDVGMILTGGTLNFQTRLSDQVYTFVNDIVTKIKLANQPKE